MRVVIFQPGQEWPKIAHLDNIHAIRQAVGGYIDAKTIQYAGHQVTVITRVNAALAGLEPNRIIDGYLTYGTIVVCGGQQVLKGLPLPVAKNLQSDCAWPMAQVARA